MTDLTECLPSALLLETHLCINHNGLAFITHTNAFALITHTHSLSTPSITHTHTYTHPHTETVRQIIQLYTHTVCHPFHTRIYLGSVAHITLFVWRPITRRQSSANLHLNNTYTHARTHVYIQRTPAAQYSHPHCLLSNHTHTHTHTHTLSLPNLTPFPLSHF